MPGQFHVAFSNTVVGAGTQLNGRAQERLVAEVKRDLTKHPMSDIEQHFALAFPEQS